MRATLLTRQVPGGPCFFRVVREVVAVIFSSKVVRVRMQMGVVAVCLSLRRLEGGLRLGLRSLPVQVAMYQSLRGTVRLQVVKFTSQLVQLKWLEVC